MISLPNILVVSHLDIQYFMAVGVFEKKNFQYDYWT